ncbi:MAG: hypothetical protein IJJ83_08290 [Muribaculaceae bacterium]|nr:hypothetical protein [Muribaculaceae bacterium]
MENIISKHFGLSENDVEAQDLNEEVTANAATSVNNVHACEGEVDDLHEAGGAPADEELDSSSNHGEQEQKPLMKERVVHTLKKKTLGKVLVIKSNRKNPRQIKAKQKSCRKHGLLVSALFADATAAFDVGYVLVNPITGKEVKSREETFGMLVIMEGNTRFWAWLEEVKRIKEEKRKSKGESKTEKPFEYTFTYRHITDPQVYKDQYRHINIDNVPTKTEDFARDFLDTEKANKIIAAYAGKIDRGLTPKAAGFATKGKEVKKADVQALLAGKLPCIFNDGDTDDIELYQMVFDGVCEGFGIEKDAPIKNKVLKGTFIWHWTAKKIREAYEDKRIDAADKVINMFAGMSAQDSERINNAEKTESQTREQVIHGILDEMYNRNKQ